MEKIVLIGGYGFDDMGDESQLTASLINLKKFIPDAKFLALSDHPEHTLKHHKVETDYSINYYLIRRPHLSRIEKLLKLDRYIWVDFFLRSIILLFNAHRLRKSKKPVFLSEDGKKFLENLKDANLLFNVGGGNLNSKWRLGGLYSRCLTYIICRNFRIPIILSGQSIGPIYGWFDKHLAKFALNTVNVITLREKLSRRVLEQIGVTKPLIKVTADDSTSLPPIDQKKLKALFSKEKISEHHLLVGMNMIELGILSREKMNKAKKLLAEISDYLISKYNARIIFVPMQYIVSADDRVAASEVLQLMKHKDRAHIISSKYDDQTLKSIISRMDLAVGLRYHFIVFAVNSQVPSIGIYLDDYYAIKIRGILELVDQEKYICNIEKTSLEDLIKLVENIFLNRDSIRKHFGERTKELQNLSLLSIRCAARLLSKI